MRRCKWGKGSLHSNQATSAVWILREEAAEQFSTVYQQLRPELEQQCINFTDGDFHSAREIAQESFLRALLRWEELESREELLPWLCTVAERIWYDRCKSAERQKVTHRPEEELNCEIASPTTLDIKVEKLLEELPEKQAGVLKLHYLDGIELKEIAAKRDVQPGTVYSQHHRALERLRKIIGKSDEASQGQGGGEFVT